MKIPLAIAITAYNRPKMLAHVLSALYERCNWDLIERLYIFSDGPRDREDIPLVNHVRDLAHFERWKPKLEVVEHAKNISQKHAIPYAMDYVFSKHEIAVHLEDDVVPGPHFLPFMAQALERYANEPSVYGICGYARSMPADVVSSWPYDAHLYPRVGTAAWGTWRRAWSQHIRRDLPDMAQIANSEGIDFSIGGDDLPHALEKYLTHTEANWSLAWGLRMAMNDGLYLYPMRSLVENIGHGTGVSTSSHHGPPLVMAERPVEKLPPAYPEFKKLSIYADLGRDVFMAMRALYP